MSNTPNQNYGALAFTGQFPLTAPDLAVAGSPSNPSAGGVVDMDTLATETISELQNLQQDLTNRLTEIPGSNLDFNFTTTYTPVDTALLIIEADTSALSFPTVTETASNSRGVGLMQYLNGTAEKLAGLPAKIDAEFIQDPRVVASLTAPISQRADGSWLISTQIQTVAGVLGLTWSWSQAGVAALPIAA